MLKELCSLRRCEHRFFVVLIATIFFIGNVTTVTADQASQAIAKAQTLYTEHQYFPALKAAKDAERLTARLPNANDPRRARALLLLADSMHATGQILEAELAYQRVTHAYKRLGKGYEKQLLEAFGKLGVLYSNAGMHYRAGQVLSKARYWTERLYGSKHQKLADAFNDWGEQELARRADDFAMNYFQKAYPIAGELPKTSATYIRTMLNSQWYFRDVPATNEQIALALKGKLKLKSTIGKCEHTERMKELQRQFETGELDNKPLYIKMIRAYAAHYRQKGKKLKSDECWIRAESYYLQATQLTRDLYGYRHPKVALVLGSLGRFHIDRKNFGAAAEVYEEALKILQFRFGEKHPLVKDTMSILRYTYRDMGQGEKEASMSKKLEGFPEERGDFNVVYATTRDWDPENKTYSQLGKTNKLTYGEATVRVDAHTLFDRIARVVDSIGETDRSGKALSYAKGFEVRNVQPKNFASIGAKIAKNAEQAIRFPNQALLFVHGYNVNHEEAVKRAAQIAYDLEFDGAIILFSWNSAGAVLGYVNDRKRAEAAADSLVKLLDYATIALPRKIKYHILAHSMGNRVLSHAMDTFVQRGPGGRTPNLGEIIMAHADIDLASCRKMGAVKKFARGVTNYVNADDMALWVSSAIRLGEGRCGRVAQSFPGVETIDTTGMGGRDGQTLLGMDTQNHHGVFVNDPILFGDMYRLLSNGRRPVQERTPEFRPKSDNNNPVHWVFDKRVSSHESAGDQ